MTTLNVSITPRRSALLAGHANVVEALVRIRAPAAPAGQAHRKPLNLALVIDRSGSMSGQPLEEAKRCATFIVDSLDRNDRVSVVSYDSQPTIVIPTQPVGNRTGLREAIRAIQSGGTTALYDGWYQGAGQAALHADPAYISRVLLLSDGQANAGLTNRDEIAARCASMAEAGVTTSTYGLGHDFNEDLMVAMARAGHGNHYYGQTAADLMDPFREEFELLQALCARRLRLALRAPANIAVEVLNDYPRDEQGRWCLPDLAYGGEAWAAVRLTLPEGLSTGPTAGETLVLEAALAFADLGGTEHTAAGTALSLPWLPAEAYAAVASDSRVAERFGEIAAAALQEQARLAAGRGDWDRVDALLAQAQQDAATNPWLSSILDALRHYAARRETAHFSKEAMYASRKLRSRLADADEAAGSYAPEAEMVKPGFLRRKPEQGKDFPG